MALRLYLRVLEKFPVATMSVTTGTLMAAGDSIAQIAVEKTQKPYDYGRTGRFLGFGLFIGGPMFRLWYLGLDKAFKGTRLGPLKMLACDQLLWAPSFLTFFLGTMGTLRGDSTQQIKDKISNDIWPVLKTNWKIWPAVQLVNFYLVPLQHRVLVVNFVALGWNTYMAWVSEADSEAELTNNDQETTH
ncbi:protein SYM1-like isoform X2 [Mizuhopecten yessoensis]|uniref:Mitochondrial inner membrane protein Mpv17 n=1 Tax=Mizuhopecten yessoensis TaxID=6573 RepID=A0A210QKP2_MIZYE|nr:protein SYM1-like isoform X2 [Mizuhopecten yessoensis]OWF49312.1 Protein SYM1 [Mizuhopecten yessoensis]